VLLTIAICTYRRPKTLEKILEALSDQISDNIEILVVDNDPEQSALPIVERKEIVKYAFEANRGVVNARNRAVNESRGQWVAFLDDDELPKSGWAKALLNQIEMNTDASFGLVIPAFLEPPPAAVSRLLRDIYTRDLRRTVGEDITDLWDQVGTGNSLFRRASCFPDQRPFDTKFNQSGGEDVSFVRGLTKKGIRLRWMPDAIVEEIIPPERADLSNLMTRKFSHGQQRVIVVRGKGGIGGNSRALLWMSVGLAQILFHGIQYLALRAFQSPKRLEALVRLTGGIGKLLWWRTAPARYG